MKSLRDNLQECVDLVSYTESKHCRSSQRKGKYMSSAFKIGIFQQDVSERSGGFTFYSPSINSQLKSDSSSP